MVQTLTLLALVFGLTLMPAEQRSIAIDQIRTEEGRAFSLVAVRVDGGFDVQAEIDGKVQTAMFVRKTKAPDVWTVKLGGKDGEPMRIDLGILREKAPATTAKAGAGPKAPASLDVSLAQGSRTFRTERGSIVLMRTPTGRYLQLPGEHSLIALH